MAASSPHVLNLGAGSAYADDRLDPVTEMAGSGRVSYIGFDCLAERTMALAQIRRRENPAAGQDRRIAALVPLLGGFLRAGGRVVGNFGAANPDGARDDFARCLKELGLAGVRIGTIYGDDVRELVRELDAELPELGVGLTARGHFLVLDVGVAVLLAGEEEIRCANPAQSVALATFVIDPYAHRSSSSTGRP